ncbi:GtrA family protein [Nocardia sp. NPDC058640]|uniref:GtrA family protein n=1 Tax=Nocardia sp. NPDC058640 TaxID=3346571 RepID=UPI003654B925
MTAPQIIHPGMLPTSAFAAWIPVPRNDFGRALHYLRSDHPFAQLIRFALVGGASNIAYVLLFMTMHGSGPLVANVAGSMVSTVIANELHRQLTFRAGDRVGGFTAQWEGGGLALLGLGISTGALAGLDVVAPNLGGAVQAGAVLAIMAVVGGLRFLALRSFVFGSTAPQCDPAMIATNAYAAPVPTTLSLNPE